MKIGDKVKVDAGIRGKKPEGVILSFGKLPIFGDVAYVDFGYGIHWAVPVGLIEVINK